MKENAYSLKGLIFLPMNLIAVFPCMEHHTEAFSGTMKQRSRVCNFISTNQQVHHAMISLVDEWHGCCLHIQSFRTASARHADRNHEEMKMSATIANFLSKEVATFAPAAGSKRGDSIPTRKEAMKNVLLNDVRRCRRGERYVSI
jgi:hypothetical protein